MKMHHLGSSRKSARRLALLLVCPFVCLSLCKIQPSDSLFNCFTPSMFNKLGKVGQPGGAYLGGHSGERANWYPSMQQQVYPYGPNPTSRLFRPKWFGSMFGPKHWMNWRMNAANMNFYRPAGMGYWPPQSQVQPAPPPSSLLNSNYPNQYSDQFSLPSYPTGGTTTQQLINNANLNQASGSYGQSSPSQLATNTYNEGWSYPYVTPHTRPTQQGGQSYGAGDSYSVSPNLNQYQPPRQQMDPYGTKGGSGAKQQSQQQYGTTKKPKY